MLEEVEKAFKALREALEIGAEYAQQALTEFDNQYRRHPSTEDRRQVIVEDLESIKEQLGLLEWAVSGRRETVEDWANRLGKSRALAKVQEAECRRRCKQLQDALNDAVSVAQQAHQYWAGGEDKKAIQLMIALAGELPGHDKRTDAIHEVRAASKESGTVDAAAVSGEEGAPIVENKDAPGDLAIGDYVFASQWSDCDPCDPWAVGNVTDIGRDFVVIGEVGPRKFPKAMRISQEQGHRIVERYPEMEMNCHSEKRAAIAEVFGSSKESGAV